MSSKFYFKKTVYEKDGTPHKFEALEQTEPGAAPYVILMDETFLATAESLHEIGTEIVDAILWHGWNTFNPCFA